MSLVEYIFDAAPGEIQNAADTDHGIYFEEFAYNSQMHINRVWNSVCKSTHDIQ